MNTCTYPHIANVSMLDELFIKQNRHAQKSYSSQKKKKRKTESFICFNFSAAPRYEAKLYVLCLQINFHLFKC